MANAFIVASSQSILRIWVFSVACTGHVFYELGSKDWLWEEFIVLNVCQHLLTIWNASPLHVFQSVIVQLCANPDQYIRGKNFPQVCCLNCIFLDRGQAASPSEIFFDISSKSERFCFHLNRLSRDHRRCGLTGSSSGRRRQVLESYHESGVGQDHQRLLQVCTCSVPCFITLAALWNDFLHLSLLNIL